MSSEEKIKKLEELNEQAVLGGGEARIERQHQAGKLTARERIELLFDPGAFVEIDKFVTHRCTDFDMQESKILGDDKHVRAGERCQTCHGDVTQYDVLPQEVSINMTACMNCHTQRGVENKCFWCHELNGF